jgi:glycosyltransferase involved in cell wall biosynthesis
MNDFTNYKVIKETKNKQNIFFTIAIPHYRYRGHLQIAIDSIVKQTYKNFEILISDDSSPCDAHEIVPQQLYDLNVDFQYIRHDKNQGYDRNVRFCIKKARGKYVFLLGNDDDLTDENVLGKLHDKLQLNNNPKIAFTSYSDFLTGELIKRAQNTRIFYGCTKTAIKLFRAFSINSD